MTADYVSPFDERVRPPEPIAPRPASISGLRVTLLDIRKNRGAEFLDVPHESAIPENVLQGALVNVQL